MGQGQQFALRKLSEIALSIGIERARTRFALGICMDWRQGLYLCYSER